MRMHGKATTLQSSSKGANALFLLLALTTTAACGIVACSKKAPQEESATSTAYVTTGQGLVISQVYGGTGDPRALYNRDFVELFNRSSGPVSLKGLSIHFAGSIGELVFAGNLPDNAVVPPGGYYLVGFGAGEAGQDLRVDAAGTSSVNILPANGKVALVRTVEDPDASAQALGCGSVDAGHCSSNGRVIDLVGYGVASDHEGAAAAPAPSVAKALVRKGNGCTDTRNSASDFELAAPAPRWSQTRAALCSNAVSPEQTTNNPNP